MSFGPLLESGSERYRVYFTRLVESIYRAGFEAAEYTPIGPNAALMSMFSEVENVLMLWCPLALVGVLSAMCLARLALLVGRHVFGSSARSTADANPSISTGV
jgi:hypothetical protein